MTRWAGLILCAILGVDLLLCGLIVPAHLRAVEGSLLQKAGRHTPTLVAKGVALASQNNLGAAQLLARAAQEQRVLGWESLGQAVTNVAVQHPEWHAWGGGPYHLQILFAPGANRSDSSPEPITDWLIHSANRTTVLELLRTSSHIPVLELLRCRQLTNTTVFASSQSSAGQALDSALALGGLLIQEQVLGPGLTTALQTEAEQANNGSSTAPLENTLLDLMSLGQRLNWAQLSAFLGQVPDPDALHVLAHQARLEGARLPVLYSTVVLSGQPAAVAHYLTTFSQTGLDDLGASLRYGQGGVNELLRQNQRLYNSELRRQLGATAWLAGLEDFAAEQTLRAPRAALAVKWVFYLLGGFLLAAAMHFAWPKVSELEKPLQVRGFHLAREFLFALGFLLVVLLLSEPFLTQESQKAVIPFRLSLSTVAGAVAAGTTGARGPFMNQVSLLTLLLFFVLQGLLYTASVVKLAEIRRQQVSPRVKLKLLENEDHLFDAGLYLGFVGTIVSLILVSLNIITFSLMAAYSSTSFGIVFVSFFKIFNLRPVRRRLVLEAEAQIPETEVPAGVRLAPTT
ncbi:MAG TPA: hypothetical protein VG167_17750 [Verrucomicrobiae bacterium]|nr:hypothetical protein [Verrucomicrobiae bacterium]